MNKTLAELREEARREAMLKLQFAVLPALESVIMGTPTSAERDALTQANVILQGVLTGRTA